MGQAIKDNTASITEIFSSIQGEGLHIGERQIFIRFDGCNLKCCYCDVIAKEPRQFDIDDTIESIDILNEDSIHSTVSLTGGEPLMHVDFLKMLLPLLKERCYRIYLETNGTLVSQFQDIKGLVDIVAMDIKLPSATKDISCWQEHEDFLKNACSKECFVKVVVSEDTTMPDFTRALDIVKDISMDVPFVIQPMTNNNDLSMGISAEKLLKLQEAALKSLNEVLVIPQAHKFLGVR